MQALLAITSVLIFLVPATAQKPDDSRAVIHADSRLVLVDTVVTDKMGAYVRDLRRNDFKVYEDDKEQNVTTFSAESRESRDNAPKRYMVLFFDNANSTPSQLIYARQAATRLIEKGASPNRLIAVAEFGGSLRITADFTSDSAVLKAAVAGTWLSSVGSSAAAPSGNATVDAAFNDFSARSVLAALRTMAKRLADIPGRKTLVFLSGGFPMTVETHDELIDAIVSCNRANVVVYPVDVRGLFAPGAEMRQERRSYLAGLKGLFQNTVLLQGPVFTSMGFQSKGGGARPPVGIGGRSPGSAGGSVGGAPRTLPQPNGRRSILPPVGADLGGPQQVLHVLANATGGFVVLNTNDSLVDSRKSPTRKASTTFSAMCQPAKPTPARVTL